MNELPAGQQGLTIQAIMDALIDGLRLKDEQLQEKAEAALTRIGRKALRFLKDKAQCKRTLPDHRDRLLRVVQYIEAHGKQPGNESRAVLDYLIDALRVSNKLLNAKAADLLCSMSAEVVERLVAAALINHRKTGYCVRLLEVIERIGQMPKATDQLELMILARRGNKRIYEAARAALISTHPQNWDILGGWEEIVRCVAHS
jgi:hypothetical protein